MFLVSPILIVGDLLTNKKEQVFVIALLKVVAEMPFFIFAYFVLDLFYQTFQLGHYN